MTAAAEYSIVDWEARPAAARRARYVHYGRRSAADFLYNCTDHQAGGLKAGPVVIQSERGPDVIEVGRAKVEAGRIKCTSGASF